MINSKYRDRLFRLIFGNEKYKANQLSLYNALNNSNYDNVDDLEVTTIDDCIYLGMKNDSSFLLDMHLDLYEHQSTWNPNMPIRGMIYFADLYQKYIAKNKLNIYGRKQLTLPTPQYIVFFNGDDEDMDGKDEIKLRLSDSFADKSVAGEFEWTATVKNINIGRNRELMEKCSALREYAILVDKIKRYTKEMSDIGKAADKAVNECIEEGILADFLIGHKAEVRDVILTEYNEVEVQNALKEEAADEREENINRLYKFLLENNRQDDLNRSILDKGYRRLLMSKLPKDYR